MQQRYIYALLFGVPGLVIAATLGLILFGAAAGLLWIFVLGDTAWPAWTEFVLPVGAFSVSLTLWILFVAAGFAYGRRREPDSGPDRRHVLMAAGATLVPILLLVLHQLSVGNMRPASDSRLCGEFCRERAYAAGAIFTDESRARTCICYDPSGEEELRTPLHMLAPGR